MSPRGRYASKVDRNHGEIRDALRALGVGVHDTSAAGAGMPDLLCGWRGKIVLVEVKDGKKPPSERKLTVAQVQLHDMLRQHGVEVHVVKSVDEALAVFGARVQLTAPERYAEGA